MAIFAYNCIGSFFMVSNSVKNPNTKRLRIVFGTTFAMIFLVILFTGIFGWITFGKFRDPKIDLIVFRPSIGESDSSMTIGRFTLVLSLVIFGGLKIGPMKPMMFNTLRIPYNPINNAVVSFCYCFLIGFIAATQSDVSKIVSLSGASFGTLIVFIFPTLVGIKTNYC